jgi:hypothetical protein
MTSRLISLAQWLVLVILACLSAAVGAQTITQLDSDIAGGHVRLVALTGNGASSGFAIEADLVNESASERSIDVFLARPLFLRNRGSSQNMIATQVILRNGRYSVSGGRSFISLKPGSRTPVSLIAYCADFEKDNPTRSDSFDIGTVPSHLVPVVTRIGKYSEANPNADITIAAQVAIWLAQGESSSAIREKFDYSDRDLALARAFLSP